LPCASSRLSLSQKAKSASRPAADFVLDYHFVLNPSLNPKIFSAGAQLIMPPSISAAAAAAAAVLLAHPAAAFPWYIPFNPNAEGVKGVASIGHINPAGGGANNAYGLAFAANGHVRRRARAGRRGG